VIHCATPGHMTARYLCFYQVFEGDDNRVLEPTVSKPDLLLSTAIPTML
jgi:hypothetical protein